MYDEITTVHAPKFTLDFWNLGLGLGGDKILVGEDGSIDDAKRQ